MGVIVAVNMTAWPTTDGFGFADSDVDVAVKPGVTVSVTAGEVDVRKPAFPEYTAVRLSEPTGRLLIAEVAMPETLTVPVPKKVEPL